MTHATPEGIADGKREEWEGGEENDFRAALEADEPVPTADLFRITDMQHWIDLCA
jgi:hypothetical protein